MPPLLLVGLAGVGVAVTVAADRWAKRRSAEVDDYHDREFDGSRIPVSPMPPFGN